MNNKSIGDILIEQGILTKSQKEQYAKDAQQNGVSFEEYILTNNMVSQEALAKAYAKKFGLPFVDNITEKMATPDILGKLPLKFLRENSVIPIKNENNTIVVVASDPYNFSAFDEVDLIFNRQTTRAIATRSTIIDAINRFYPLEGAKEMIEELEEDKELAAALDLSAIKEEDILGMASEAPIIKLVNHILYQAVKRNASDVHIEPYEKELQVRYRIDGILYPVLSPPKRAQAAITSRIKIMAEMNIAEKRKPQDGRIQIKVADKPFDIRVSVIPVTFGERVVMRLLDKSKTFLSLQKLGFDERDYKIIMQSIEQPNGIILVTGPTGSGKTTTLYSILNYLNKPEVNIITVEDPVEYQIQGVSQVQVKEQIGLTFATALRSILRQDPDIVMIGETRDHETAQIAIQAALTGHLVLSTVHTNNAAATITRLIDMGIEPFLITSTVLSIVAQRLVRTLCPYCKKAYKPSSEMIKRLGISEAEAKKITFYKPEGCEECSFTGYKGRMPLFEIMQMTADIIKLTMERADASRIQKQAIKDGMTLLIEDGLRKIKLGLTTIEEVIAVAASSQEFETE